MIKTYEHRERSHNRSELNFEFEKKKVQRDGEVEFLRTRVAFDLEDVEALPPGASAVNLRSTRFVINSYLWGFFAVGSSTSFNKARNAIFANSC